MARKSKAKGRHRKLRSARRREARGPDHWQPEFFRVLQSRTAGCWERAIEIKEPHLPPKLYKYRGGLDEGTKLCLHNNTVWMAAPFTMNDPMDCAVCVNWEPIVLEERRERLIGRLPVNHPKIPLLRRETDFASFMEVLIRAGSELEGTPEETIARGIAEIVAKPRVDGIARQKQFSKEFRMYTKACCFSTDPHSVIMWSHYANQHRGLCIEYTLPDLLSASPLRRMLYPVLYGDKRFDLAPWARANPDPASVQPGLPSTIAGLHKNRHWSYENEWRLMDFREGDESKGYALPAPKPTAIYMGMFMPPDDELLIQQLAPGVPLHRMELSATEYLMDPVSAAP